MKTVLTFLVVMMIATMTRAGDDRRPWPYLETTNEVSVDQYPQGMNILYPEDFQPETRATLGSTYDQMLDALKKRRIYWKRLLDVERTKRDALVVRNQPEMLKVFDEMQSQWRKLCELECKFLRGPPDQYMGSGWKASFPYFVAEQIRTRIKFLTAER